MIFEEQISMVYSTKFLRQGAVKKKNKQTKTNVLIRSMYRSDKDHNPSNPLGISKDFFFCISEVSSTMVHLIIVKTVLEATV